MPTISDDEAALVVKALEHYDAYLVAAEREDRAYQELADRLKRKPARIRNHEAGEAEESLAKHDSLVVVNQRTKAINSARRAIAFIGLAVWSDLLDNNLGAWTVLAIPVY
jgi:hypothetical protein